MSTEIELLRTREDGGTPGLRELEAFINMKKTTKQIDYFSFFH